MSERPILYYLNGSPPVRSVFLVARALNIELERRYLDLFKGEHMTPEFLKINPMHCVPTLVDAGKPLYDSHAICTYLIRKYGGEDHPLYPSDIYTRARIDQRLHFVNGGIYQGLRDVCGPFYAEGEWDISEKVRTNTHKAYAFLETFLTADPFLVGDRITVADLCASTNLSQLGSLVPIDADKYPKLTAWFRAIDEQLPYYQEENTVHRIEYMKFIEGLRAKNKAAKESAK